MDAVGGQHHARNEPMDLGTVAGGPERLCQLFFVKGDVRDSLDALHRYTEAVAADGLATTALAPFFRTVVGTDTFSSTSSGDPPALVTGRSR